MMKRLGITSRCDRPEAIELVKEIIQHLEGRAELLIDPCTAEKINARSTPVEDMRREGAVALISIGGDGTMLRAIQRMSDPLPILGVNIGTTGFLVDVSVDEALTAIDKLLSGFDVETRARLGVVINHHKLPPATNEVVIITANPAKILSYRILINEKKFDEIRADGLVFATPTGSTAYAMSAGGPILDPRVSATVIVPIAPFKLSARPWVIPDTSTIKIKLTSQGKEAFVVVDGQYTERISETKTVTITHFDTPARFIHLEENGLYEKVKKKLA
ncbi:Bifunctional NADP phosphatase/NAD kinase [Candidatus Methanoperedenaceae archaeon GB50]|nr:Bifunctional NADP phosphatase/NAD kinase [Candidatus Methanoperedenaceae archaeon GB50]